MIEQNYDETHYRSSHKLDIVNGIPDEYEGFYSPDGRLIATLTEPEDRRWIRDLAGVVMELNNLYDENMRLLLQIEKLKKCPIVHGQNCEKKPHTGEGYLHGEDDDTTYNVDGCIYCGRCHGSAD